MTTPDDPRKLRLHSAATAAFADHGFHVVESHGSYRGADARAEKNDVTISVDCDFYEREMSISIRVTGTGWLSVTDLMPGFNATKRKLPRNAKRGVLQTRLEETLAALQQNAPEVLRGGPTARDRLLAEGAAPEEQPT